MSGVPANGIELFLDEQGSGPPVLLVMGIAAQLTLWPQGLVDHLVGAGLRVLRIDNRDIGLSTHLDHLGVPDPGPLITARMLGREVLAPYDLHDMARDTLGVLDALGLERAHLVGASMGGMIAQICAIEHPERVASLTSIMSSPGDAWNTIGHPKAWMTLASQRPTTRDEAMVARWKVAQVFNGGRMPLDEASVKAAAAADFDRSFHPAGAARHFAAILATPDRRATLPGVRVPTHVIHGEIDPMIPLRGGRATAKLIPGATLQVVPDMGHHLPPASWEPVTDGIVSAVRRGTAGDQLPWTPMPS